MFELTKGNLLEASAEALVNTVNTAGIMGKGIALQFKQAYPQMFRAYERGCQAGEVKLGKVQVFDLGGLAGGPRWIINFPTKGHWRAGSRMADIETPANRQGLFPNESCGPGCTLRNPRPWASHGTSTQVWSGFTDIIPAVQAFGS